MLWRAFIPLIALILLQTLQDLEQIAKTIKDDFEATHRLLRCARQDVYERNIEDAVLYFRQKDPLFPGRPEDFLLAGELDCEGEEYLVYREVNEDLELLYPNWVFKRRPKESGAG